MAGQLLHVIWKLGGRDVLLQQLEGKLDRLAFLRGPLGDGMSNPLVQACKEPVTTDFLYINFDHFARRPPASVSYLFNVLCFLVK